ncbi:MAG: cell division protein FtsZ [Candidatus Micrarchaeota archaeon]
MDSIIAAAIKGSPQPMAAAAKKPIDFKDVKITVVGVGGAGCNTIARMHKMGLQSANTVAVNTDKRHLSIIEAGRRLLIGASMTRGLGAGGFPEVGARCAEQCRDKLAEVLDGSELVFLTAGMGGGTGTGAAPIIAEVAKKQGAIVVAMVTYPFALERARLQKADWGLERLREVCDTVVIIDNNKLVSYVPNLPMNQAFMVADTLMARSVKGISDTISLPSLVNIDFADVRSILGNAGVAMISVGEGKGNGKVNDAVEGVLKNPLLDVEYNGAKGALIHVAGGPQLTLGEVTKIGEGITDAFDPHANVIWGARVEPELGDKVRVTCVATGVTSPQIIGLEQQQKQAQVDTMGIRAIRF